MGDPKLGTRPFSKDPPILGIVQHAKFVKIRVPVIKVGSPTLNQLMRFFIIKPAVLSCAKYKLRVFSKLFLIVRVPRPFW